MPSPSRTDCSVVVFDRLAADDGRAQRELDHVASKRGAGGSANCQCLVGSNDAELQRFVGVQNLA
jgi:hypothetical protein